MVKQNRKIAKRKDNIALILDTIFRYGPISRSGIAEHLNLTTPAVTINIKPLLESKLLTSRIKISSENEANLGRPKQLLDLNPKAFYVIGVDLGPYSTNCCILDIKGNLIKEIEYEICPRDYDKAIDFISKRVGDLVDSSNIAPYFFAGIGIGTPGFVDRENGVIRYSPFGWRDVHITEDIYLLTGIPCVVDNNARCRLSTVDDVINEGKFNSVAYFHVAKGICCPFRIDNKDFSGAMFASGEIGHAIIVPNGPECQVCKKQGCLDSVASEAAVLKECKELVARGEISRFDKDKPLTIEDVLEAASYEDSSVLAVLGKAMYHLGLAISNTMKLLNPQIVFIDGFMLSNEHNRKALLDVIADITFVDGYSEVDIRILEYNKIRTAKGAALKAISQFVIEREYL